MRVEVEGESQRVRERAEEAEQKCADAGASNTIYKCNYSGAIIKAGHKYGDAGPNVLSQTAD